MLAADVAVAAGDASRPYDYDFSRIYSGVISIENAGWQDRGWMYDPNLVLVYDGNVESNLGDTAPMAITSEMKVGTAIGAVALLAVLGLGITLALTQHRK